MVKLINKNRFLEKKQKKPLTFKFERYRAWELGVEAVSTDGMNNPEEN